MPEKSNRPVLYRRRLIPNECIRLDRDEVLLREPDLLITRWRTLHPKPELDHGVSVFFLKEGWKVSRFLDRDGRLICWYCDIIDYTYDSDSDTYIFLDLLADVLIYPDGRIRVVDLDEVAQAMAEGLLTGDQAIACMQKLDALLQKIYAEKLIPLAEAWLDAI